MLCLRSQKRRLHSTRHTSRAPRILHSDELGRRYNPVTCRLRRLQGLRDRHEVALREDLVAMLILAELHDVDAEIGGQVGIDHVHARVLRGGVPGEVARQRRLRVEARQNGGDPPPDLNNGPAA